MALFDIMFDIVRFGISTAAYDEAVDKKKMYRKLVKRLEKPIENADEYLGFIKTGFDDLLETYTCNPGSAVGLYKTTYDSKVQVFQEKSLALRVTMANELATSQSKKAQAIILGNQWEMKEEQEEQKIRSEVERKRAEEAARIAAMAAAVKGAFK